MCIILLKISSSRPYKEVAFQYLFSFYNIFNAFFPFIKVQVISSSTGGEREREKRGRSEQRRQRLGRGREWEADEVGPCEPWPIGVRQQPAPKPTHAHHTDTHTLCVSRVAPGRRLPSLPAPTDPSPDPLFTSYHLFKATQLPACLASTSPAAAAA